MASKGLSVTKTLQCDHFLPGPVETPHKCLHQRSLLAAATFRQRCLVPRGHNCSKDNFVFVAPAQTSSGLLTRHLLVKIASHCANRWGKILYFQLLTVIMTGRTSGVTIDIYLSDLLGDEIRALMASHALTLLVLGHELTLQVCSPTFGLPIPKYSMHLQVANDSSQR